MPLPSPSGSLKRELDSATIEEANTEVSKLIIKYRREAFAILKGYVPSKKLPLPSMQQNMELSIQFGILRKIFQKKH